MRSIAQFLFRRISAFGASCTGFLGPWCTSWRLVTWIRETGQRIWRARPLFGYTLLSVILLSNLMAILLQSLCAKLGIVTGRDLAQACRDHYSRPVSIGLWLLCEIAICACDLAEVIGSAIALNLLFKIPLIWGVCITALDVVAVMYLQNKEVSLH